MSLLSPHSAMPAGPPHSPPRSPLCRSKNPRDHMVNVWGYSHANFFAPQARFAAGALA